MRKLLYIWLLISCATLVQAQHVMKVVTRVVEEDMRFSDEFLLEIDAEKAQIYVRVVDGNTVRLQLKQSAKNEDVKVAEEELDYIHFVKRKERNRLYLHNYAQLPASTRGLSSIINNVYTLEIPKHCHLKIKNELGSVTVSGLSTSARLDLNYCGLNMENVTGKLYVDSRIGDVTLSQCDLDAELITENVAVKMQDCRGSFDVRSLFGSLSCVLTEGLSLLNVSAEQCEVTLVNRTSIEYNYAIEVQKARITALDEIMTEQIIKVENNMQLLNKNEAAVGTIIIKSEYGDVSLY